MNLRARIYVENQKKDAQAKLEARLVWLKEKQLDSEAISQDATVRKLKGMIRKAIFRLTTIAAQEKLNQERAQAKADKLAAEEAAREKPKEEEVVVVAEEKKKKGKKEKAAKVEKAKKPAPKKGKEEKKGEKQEKQ